VRQAAATPASNEFKNIEKLQIEKRFVSRALLQPLGFDRPG
jgi:hypothetical protein